MEKNHRNELWRIGVDGTDPALLVGGNVYLAPRCSPDGKWVAYSAPGPRGWPVLWKVPIEGGQPVQLNENIALGPAISPDGTRIAVLYGYQHEGETVGDLVKVAIIPALGGPPEKTFSIPGTFDRIPQLRWTPDGKAIAFVEQRQGTSNIWAQPVDGGPPRQLTNLTTDYIAAFDWSWDGKQMAVSLGSMPHDLVLIESSR